MASLKRQLHRAFRRFGVQVQRWRDPVSDAAKLIGPSRVKCAIDGGAFRGAVTQQMLQEFPHCVVHAFEPQRESYELVAQRFQGDQRVHVHHQALSSKTDEVDLHVTSEGFTTSLLKASDPTIAPPGEGQRVTCVVLDDWRREQGQAAAEFIKLDLQGHELDALMGAEETLRAGVLGLLVEVNFYARYDGSCLFHDIASHLSERGFQVYRFYEMMNGPRGAIRQADVLFVADSILGTAGGRV